MNEEEKREYEELKSLLYTGTISQYGKRKLIDIIEKQQKEIEDLKCDNSILCEIAYTGKRIQLPYTMVYTGTDNFINKDKILAVFKKYALDEQECFFSTSDIIKFVKDMRKLMGIGD